MTATEAAPAAITPGAVASVMPSIATTGRVPATALVRRTALESDRGVPGVLGSGVVDRSDLGDHTLDLGAPGVW